MVHGPSSDGDGAVPAFGSTGNFLSIKGGQVAQIVLDGVAGFAFDWG